MFPIMAFIGLWRLSGAGRKVLWLTGSPAVENTISLPAMSHGALVIFFNDLPCFDCATFSGFERTAVSLALSVFLSRVLFFQPSAE